LQEKIYHLRMANHLAVYNKKNLKEVSGMEEDVRDLLLFEKKKRHFISNHFELGKEYLLP